MSTLWQPETGYQLGIVLLVPAVIIISTVLALVGRRLRKTRYVSYADITMLGVTISLQWIGFLMFLPLAEIYTRALKPSADIGVLFLVGLGIAIALWIVGATAGRSGVLLGAVGTLAYIYVVDFLLFASTVVEFVEIISAILQFGQ